MDGYWTTVRSALKTWGATLRLALIITIPSALPLLVVLLK